MSTAPRLRELEGYAGLKMTADEYLALGETRERYELIDGVVVMSPSPLPNHSEVILRITQQLLAFADRTQQARVFSEIDVRFSRDLVYRPDICVYRPDRLAPRPSRLEIPPDLIVEVLSGGTKPLDLITKRDDYERFGVNEYWAVDPVTARVHCWQRQGKVLLEKAVEGEALSSSALPGFVLDLRPIGKLAQPEA
jgi:Uma2 family endonuclease